MATRSAPTKSTNRSATSSKTSTSGKAKSTKAKRSNASTKAPAKSARTTKAASTKGSSGRVKSAKSSTSAKSATSSSTQQADAIAVLKADHRHVTELFDRFESLGERAYATRERTLDRIIEELSIHAGIEENVFYPAVRARFAERDESMVLEALEEHHVVKLLLRELESMDPRSERYVAKVTVLREIVEHHVEEEETELFKRVRDSFSRSELRDLGAELEAARSAAPTRPHPSAPDEPPASTVANVLTAPLDAAADITHRAGDAVRSMVG
jgi:hemerythrin superfamily protein